MAEIKLCVERRAGEMLIISRQNLKKMMKYYSKTQIGQEKLCPIIIDTIIIDNYVDEKLIGAKYGIPAGLWGEYYHLYLY